MKKILFALTVAALLSSCATPQQKAMLEMDASRPMICQQGQDCEVKWSRALVWVQDNSRWKLRIANDSLITTEGPFDTTDASFSINKIPLGNGQYSIAFRAGCGNMFGCVPSLLELKASFVNAVLLSQATPPAVLPQDPTAKKLKFGATLAKNNKQSAAMIGMTETKGVMIITVFTDSVAQRAGFKQGDVVLKWGDVPTNEPPELQEAINKTAAGAAIPITIWRYEEQTKGSEKIITAQF